MRSARREYRDSYGYPHMEEESKHLLAWLVVIGLFAVAAIIEGRYL